MSKYLATSLIKQHGCTWKRSLDPYRRHQHDKDQVITVTLSPKLAVGSYKWVTGRTWIEVYNKLRQVVKVRG